MDGCRNVAVEDTEQGDISFVHKAHNASFHRIVNLEKPERSLLKSVKLSQRCSACTTPDWSSIFHDRTNVGLIVDGNARLLWEKVTRSSQDVKALYCFLCNTKVWAMEMPKRVMLFIGDNSLFIKKSDG